MKAADISSSGATPHPKPCYLFALVGGDLVRVADDFTTRSGRKVALEIYVQPQNQRKCQFALDSLKAAMRWDEEVYGREYDLDVYMIVAVDHFNMGAMENKGLNIFNSALVLASPDTATDADYERIEAVVAHEYFHNWSGNRVTCRDWFQLCLKEGFYGLSRAGVFSGYAFAARAAHQGMCAGSWRCSSRRTPARSLILPRPDSYIAIDNFYTATVYEKGAELARMLRLLLGAEKFRAACDLYFERHDGTAATVEDFIKAMEDAGGRDLEQFRLWYSDAGAPRVTVEQTADARSIRLSQKTAPTPGQPHKAPRHIPIAYAAFGADTGGLLEEGVFELCEAAQTLTLRDAGEPAILSVNRAFSAPVSIAQDLSIDQRLMLIACENEPFNRWAATDGLWRDVSLAMAGLTPMSDVDGALARFAEALGLALGQAGDDPALAAELLSPPSAVMLAQDASVIEPARIVEGRRKTVETVARVLEGQLRELHARFGGGDEPYAPDARQAGARALKNAALYLLVAGGDGAIALEAARNSDEYDRRSRRNRRARDLGSTGTRRGPSNGSMANWRDDALVVNKWLSWRAMAPGAEALADVEMLLGHEAYDAGVPNKVRAVVGSFSNQNVAAFHREDGAGYDFFVSQLLAIDAKNPQLAARSRRGAGNLATP